MTTGESGSSSTEVRLQMVGPAHESAEAAVASLESTIAASGPGTAVNTAGGAWVEDVGDRAFQNGTSVQVAAKGRCLTVTFLNVDPVQNRWNQALPDPYRIRSTLPR